MKDSTLQVWLFWGFSVVVGFGVFLLLLFQQIICWAISIRMFVYHWKADPSNKDEKIQAAV